jgi:HSP20 family molecular chaperone IbpA
MQSYRLVPSTTLRRVISKPSKATMPCYVATPRHSYHTGFGPFFNRGAVSPFTDISSSLQPFIRLLDEELSHAATSRPLRTYQPRFDVREEKEAYHLQGELPGIAPKDLTIEFKDENTLVISGKTVRESKTSNADQTEAAATEPTPDTASETASAYKSPTVEDEEFVDVGEGAGEKAPATEEKGKQVEKPATKSQQPANKYWVSERSVGEFHRTFNFPGRINQEAVTANLKDGILNLVVPKAAQKEPRRINIE